MNEAPVIAAGRIKDPAYAIATAGKGRFKAICSCFTPLYGNINSNCFI
jgi:hypothetical protein